jgi:hypothetical protein
MFIENGYLKFPIQFFTQHKRDGSIFRANPDWQETNFPWYDWARIKWDGYENSVPAQLLIFIYLSLNFIKPFQLRQSFVTEAGFYAIGHSFKDGNNIKAHSTSKLVQYGELISDENDLPELCIFSVESITNTIESITNTIESITNTMVAIPYNTNKSIIEAKECLILRPKETWYDCLIKNLRERIMNKETTYN